MCVCVRERERRGVGEDKGRGIGSPQYTLDTVQLISNLTVWNITRNCMEHCS